MPKALVMQVHQPIAISGKVFTLKVPFVVYKTSKNFIFLHLSRFLQMMEPGFMAQNSPKVFTREHFLNGL
jgi:hypothetical protein